MVAGLGQPKQDAPRQHHVDMFRQHGLAPTLLGAGLGVGRQQLAIALAKPVTVRDGEGVSRELIEQTSAVGMIGAQVGRVTGHPPQPLGVVALLVGGQKVEGGFVDGTDLGGGAPLGDSTTLASSTAFANSNICANSSWRLADRRRSRGRLRNLSRGKDGSVARQ